MIRRAFILKNACLSFLKSLAVTHGPLCPAHQIKVNTPIYTYTIDKVVSDPPRKLLQIDVLSTDASTMLA